MPQPRKDSRDTLAGRLDDLSAQISKLEQSTQEKTQRSRHGGMRDAGLGIQVMIELVCALCVGGLIGYGLDHIFSTKPWFLVLFFLLGGVAGVMNVVRLSERHKLQRLQKK